MTRKYTYYQNTFDVTWSDGSTERVTTETSHDADRLPRYGDRIRIERFDHAYTRRGLIFRWKVAVRGSFEQVRELNWEHVTAIERVETETEEVIVEA